MDQKLFKTNLIFVLVFTIVNVSCKRIEKGEKSLVLNSAEKVERPNLILILTDDLGYADVGFNGCQDIPTPNIDRIAEQGVKFTNGYVTWAACGPSRAGMITGRHQERFGFSRNPLFAPNDPEMGLPLSEETLADVLKKANYKSAILGKWHLGAHESLHPLKRGFDDFYGFLSGGHHYLPEKWILADEYEAKTQFDGYSTKLLRNHDRVEENEYLTDALSREAVNYIAKYQESPFFIYLAYNAPHTPLQATEKYLKKFDHIKDKKRKTYAAMVSAVDYGVGRVLDQLDALNLSENTIVVFLSDNGGPEHRNASDNSPLRGQKGDLYEGGIRVPFAMKWPSKISAGTIYDAPIVSLDIFATIIAQGQRRIETKNEIDGVNLIPYITRKMDGEPHERLFWRTFDKDHYALRNGKNKLVRHDGKDHLFDLNKDISEKKSLNQVNPVIFNSLYEEYKDWRTQLMDPRFMGLGQDSLYNVQHPKRFTRLISEK